MRNLIVISILFSIAISGFAQKHRNSGLYIETHATQGIVIPSNDFVRGDNREELPINNFSAR